MLPTAPRTADKRVSGRRPSHVVIVGPDGQPVAAVPASALQPPSDDDDESDLTSLVEQPAKVMRIGSMIRQLLEEVKSAPLDDASRSASRRSTDVDQGARDRAGARAGRGARAADAALHRRRRRPPTPSCGSRRPSSSAGSRASSTASRPRSTPSRWRPGPSSSRSAGRCRPASRSPPARPDRTASSRSRTRSRPGFGRDVPLRRQVRRERPTAAEHASGRAGRPAPSRPRAPPAASAPAGRSRRPA